MREKWVLCWCCCAASRGLVASPRLASPLPPAADPRLQLFLALHLLRVASSLAFFASPVASPRLATHKKSYCCTPLYSLHFVGAEAPFVDENTQLYNSYIREYICMWMYALICRYIVQCSCALSCLDFSCERERETDRDLIGRGAAGSFASDADCHSIRSLFLYSTLLECTREMMRCDVPLLRWIMWSFKNNSAEPRRLFCRRALSPEATSLLRFISACALLPFLRVSHSVSPSFLASPLPFFPLLFSRTPYVLSLTLTRSLSLNLTHTLPRVLRHSQRANYTRAWPDPFSVAWLCFKPLTSLHFTSMHCTALHCTILRCIALGSLSSQLPPADS